MTDDLIVTNGDSTADLLRAAGFQAEIVPWRDVLHEGPVPTLSLAHADDLEQLSSIRAAFLSDAFDQSPGKLIDGFRARDRALRRHDGYDEVTLWFEHDLYDQLQLLQILAFFHHERRSASPQLVQADDYLGMQTPDTIGRFEVLKAPVSIAQTSLAASLFSAFRRPTPADLAPFLEQDLSPLPHMQQALIRLFEELPSTADGLSRSQRHALLLIEQESYSPKRLFGAVQATEQAIFMGDWSFWRCLEELAFNTQPLLQGLPNRFHSSTSDKDKQRYLDAKLTLTDTGHAVLAGSADHALINSIDRWLGGTHIAGDRIWRWDNDAVRLAPPG